MKEFFFSDIAYSLGKILLSIPVSHQLSCQKRTEVSFPTFMIMPSSIIDLILDVFASLLSSCDHVPSFTFLNISDEAFPLISCTDMRIFFHRLSSDSENRHHHLNNNIKFLCIIFPTPRPPNSFGSSIFAHLIVGHPIFPPLDSFAPPQKNLLCMLTIF